MSDNTEESIPISRLNQEIERRKALEAQLGELRAKAKGLEEASGTIDSYRKQVETLQSDLASVRSRSEAMLGMAEAGVTDSSVRDFLFYKFESQDAEGREDWGGWWQGELSSPSAVLRPFVEPTSGPPAQQPAPQIEASPAESAEPAAEPGAAAAPDAPSPAEPSGATVRPNVNGGAAPQPLPGPAFAPGELARMASADPKAFAKKWREGEFRN